MNDIEIDTLTLMLADAQKAEEKALAALLKRQQDTTRAQVEADVRSAAVAALQERLALIQPTMTAVA